VHSLLLLLLLMLLLLMLQALDADDDEEAGEGAALRNVNQDVQRALGALGTQEAADAFAAGGCRQCCCLGVTVWQFEQDLRRLVAAQLALVSSGDAGGSRRLRSRCVGACSAGVLVLPFG
jgi:hypothetical protein